MPMLRLSRSSLLPGSSSTATKSPKNKSSSKKKKSALCFLCTAAKLLSLTWIFLLAAAASFTTVQRLLLIYYHDDNITATTADADNNERKSDSRPVASQQQQQQQREIAHQEDDDDDNHLLPLQLQTPPNNDKPLNILILYPDDWRHDSIGGVGPVVQTPFLNQLASQGIRFTQNCVTTSVCWVSRATLYTGQHLARHKSYLPKTPEFYKTWNISSWPALLRRHRDYHVGHVGKWQFLAKDGVRPKQLFSPVNGGRITWVGQHEIEVRGRGVVRTADLDRSSAVQFLQQRPRDQPFALTVAFYPPKAVGLGREPGAQYKAIPELRERLYGEAVQVPRPTSWEHANVTAQLGHLPPFFAHEMAGRARYRQRFETEEQWQASMKNYYALVSEVDQACERIVEELKNQGILNETMVIFTTDNGYFHSEHGLAGKWYPYQVRTTDT